ncbi:MAG TPA: hypothetical protein VFH48_30960 [Chloroflexota bacterium]|nr:hypothetical protein [Chloroflexota bacterium]
MDAATLMVCPLADLEVQVRVGCVVTPDRPDTLAPIDTHTPHDRRLDALEVKIDREDRRVTKADMLDDDMTGREPIGVPLTGELDCSGADRVDRRPHRRRQIDAVVEVPSSCIDAWPE